MGLVGILIRVADWIPRNGKGNQSNQIFGQPFHENSEILPTTLTLMQYHLESVSIQESNIIMSIIKT